MFDFQFSSRCTRAPLLGQTRPVQSQESWGLSSVPQDLLCHFGRFLLYDSSLMAAVTSLSHKCCVFTLASAMTEMLKEAARSFTFPTCAQRRLLGGDDRRLWAPPEPLCSLLCHRGPLPWDTAASLLFVMLADLDRARPLSVEYKKVKTPLEPRYNKPERA